MMSGEDPPPRGIERAAVTVAVDAVADVGRV